VQAAQHLLVGLALQVGVAAGRQLAKPVLDAAQQFTPGLAGQPRQQPVEAEIGTVLADEVQHQAARLALVQPQAAADLLLEQHRALRRPQQQPACARPPCG